MATTHKSKRQKAASLARIDLEMRFLRALQDLIGLPVRAEDADIKRVALQYQLNWSDLKFRLATL